VSVAAGNLFQDIASAGADEQVTVLLEQAGLRIQRIVSHAHASPPGHWYDQDDAEWVLVVSGAAGLLIEGEREPRRLAAGDYVFLPPHVRHRVEWTAADQPTVWLAVHLQEGSDSALYAMLRWQ